MAKNLIVGALEPTTDPVVIGPASVRRAWLVAAGGDGRPDALDHASGLVSSGDDDAAERVTADLARLRRL